jgi:uncharacterized membrane protein
MQRDLVKILEPKTNGPEIAILLTDLLNVKISDTTLTREIEQHPDNPSLLSVSDVLNTYGIANIGVKFDKEKFAEIPMPFVTQVKGLKNKSKFFTIASRVEGNSVQYYDPEKHRWSSLDKNDFIERCSGVALLIEAEEGAGEKDYIKIRRKEKRKLAANYLLALCVPAIILIADIVTLIQHGPGVLLQIIFSLISLGGAIVTTLLLWYELDQHNPVLQQICSAGKHSKAAKIAGVSWSAIGFSYFTGMLFLLIFSGIANPSALFVVSWINALALPYIIFSIYYQWRVVKQWCVLCLTVVATFLLQATITFLGSWHTVPLFNAPDAVMLISTAAAFTIPFVLTVLLMPAFQKTKESKQTSNELQKLKHNRQIFEALLHKQKRLAKNPDGLGIVVGNPDAPFKLLKVCNPYCGPCARAHSPMEELLHNNPDVQIQLIFTASNKDGDISAPPVKHLLAVAEKNDEPVLKQALDDWYLADTKDYDVFAAKYPMNGELKKQDEKVDSMKSWCIDTEIAYTPTFFVSIPGDDGQTTYHRLPELYTVSDLKYFFSI